MYFTPVVVTRLLSVLYFFEQALYSYHSIPDIWLIDVATATEFGHAFEDQLQDKENMLYKSDKIKIPKFEGASN